MEQCWRWFGPDDAMRLADIAQTGASGIVTALHHIPYGTTWPVAEIERRRDAIAADASLGLRWSVVETLPVAEAIKLGEGDLAPLFDAYRQSLRNLAACGITTVCYNFMAVVDWTRTHLSYALPRGGTALRFDMAAYAAFDVHILRRPDAAADYDDALLDRARDWFERASETDKARLLAAIMAGLPGAFDRYDVAGLRKMLRRYRGLGKESLRDNYARFLREVVPAAEECGVALCVHPDDPPRDLFGLARIVSSADDLQFILDASPSPANGITFCTGALGAGLHNDVPAMAARFAPHIRFAHLRNVAREGDGSFVEADHLGGDVDLVAVVDTLLGEQSRRQDAGDPRWRVPFRPDHGHELLDDVGRGSHPGYTLIGRMRGLAELRGAMAGLTARRRPV